MKGNPKFIHESYSNAGEGLVIVKDNIVHMSNYIQPDGSILLDEWVELANKFSCGLAKVNHNARVNFIRPDGTKLSRNGWWNGEDFKNGFAVVYSSWNRANHIRPDGTLVCNEWWREAYDFQCGLAMVTSLVGLVNHIRPDGSLLSDMWWAGATSFKDGVSLVKRMSDGRMNHIRTDGTLVSDEWWTRARQFSSGTAAVLTDSLKWITIGKDGKGLGI